MFPQFTASGTTTW